ncbi:MAG: hypothetical protein H0V09_04535 [Gemmatimonadetes bacterium]|nr:hypothetical protein [Gemmatimonadota bacterium]
MSKRMLLALSPVLIAVALAFSSSQAAQEPATPDADAVTQSDTLKQDGRTAKHGHGKAGCEGKKGRGAAERTSTTAT